MAFNQQFLGRKRQNKLLTFPEEDAAHSFNKYFVSIASNLVANSYPNNDEDNSFRNYLGRYDMDDDHCLKKLWSTARLSARPVIVHYFH